MEEVAACLSAGLTAWLAAWLAAGLTDGLTGGLAGAFTGALERLLTDRRDSMGSQPEGSGHVNDLSWRVIGAAIEVHRELGPGLMESTYEAFLAEEMARRGLSFSRQHHFPVLYKDRVIRSRYRLDFLVEERVIVEIKCVERFDPIHTAQMLTYLNLTGCHLGLLINFNVRVLKGGIRRIIRGVPTPLPAPRLPHD